jgi:peptide subunit release factor 1 (eRF1)
LRELATDKISLDRPLLLAGAQQQAEQERLRAEQAEARMRAIAEHLRALGIDPETF